jgi:hypothetical protein
MTLALNRQSASLDPRLENLPRRSFGFLVMAEVRGSATKKPPSHRIVRAISSLKSRAAETLLALTRQPDLPDPREKQSFRKISGSDSEDVETGKTNGGTSEGSSRLREQLPDIEFMAEESRNTNAAARMEEAGGSDEEGSDWGSVLGEHGRYCVLTVRSDLVLRRWARRWWHWISRRQELRGGRARGTCRHRRPQGRLQTKKMNRVCRRRG